ncbi:FAD:protein FMN transferase [Janthinobacterium sp. UMAB-56]|uniref:FAD:protein FMN transferase n=1 Tax=Janthinobacterium sp. UMAB-56 TaxID=1365361 RepID=UPI00214C83B4|nr:FAD:protein FMN transferase [Janthinobacterium sp. UMAB-56]
MKTSFEHALQRYSLNGATMGGRYTAIFYATGQADVAAIGASLYAAVDRVDRQMSTWNAASDLSRLNAAPENTWLAVPQELALVLAAGLQVSRESGGAFDMAVGQLVEDWGFGPSQGRPSPQIAAQHGKAYHPATDALDVDLAGRQVRKRAPLMLDLSGIAKGFGVDQLAHCLDGWGIDSYLVGIDGEMRARSSRPDGKAWSVAIEKPTPGIREIGGVMELHDMAIATSGDYRRWVEIDGTRHAHTMHPALRLPVSNRLAAATVLAPSCMLADAWATAFMVLGDAEGVALASKRGMDVLFVLRHGAALEEILLVDGKIA